MAMTRAPLCAELSSAATACSSRIEIPLAVAPLAVAPLTVAPLASAPLAVAPLGSAPLAGVAPWRMWASSCPSACCSARASGRRLEFCHRGSGVSGKSWGDTTGSTFMTDNERIAVP